MSVQVLWNTLHDARRRRVAEQAIVRLLATRPPDERWLVKLTQSEAIPGWMLAIRCPNRAHVAWHFMGVPEQEQPEMIQQRTRELLEEAGCHFP